MTCECGKPITSKITGALCTACYFAKRQPPTKVEVAPVVVLEKEQEKKTGVFTCSECNEIHEYTNGEQKCLTEHKPSKAKEVPIKDIKYCQSCMERGYGLNLATREWQPGYFICDDCFTPLLENVLNVPEQAVAGKVKEISAKVNNNSPLLKQVYDYLNIPEPLRFNSSEAVLRARNDIFNFHATALVNQKLEDITSKIEELSVLLFQVKIAIEPKQDYINRVKHEQREQAGLLNLEKSEKEFTKGPSKVKRSKDEKMAKQLGMTLEKYLEMVKFSRKQEFDKIVDRKKKDND